jgi:hypothetical protein
MNQKQIDKVWTLSIALAVLLTCYALRETSTKGFGGVIHFIEPLLLISLTAGLIKFQRKAWVLALVVFLIAPSLVSVYVKTTILGKIGFFILELFILGPIAYFLLRWTKPIWVKHKGVSTK